MVYRKRDQGNKGEVTIENWWSKMDELLRDAMIAGITAGIVVFVTMLLVRPVVEHVVPD